MDDVAIDFVFGESGTTFSTPALLDLAVYGVDLSGVNPESVNIYYVNPNGQWEVMPSEQVTVNVEAGYIYILNAEISHFSRYALSND